MPVENPGGTSAAPYGPPGTDPAGVLERTSVRGEYQRPRRRWKSVSRVTSIARSDRVTRDSAWWSRCPARCYHETSEAHMGILVFMTRQAISPRLAIRIFLNIFSPSIKAANQHQGFDIVLESQVGDSGSGGMRRDNSCGGMPPHGSRAEAGGVPQLDILTYNILIIKYYMRLISTSGPLPRGVGADQDCYAFKPTNSQP